MNIYIAALLLISHIIHLLISQIVTASTLYWCQVVRVGTDMKPTWM